jgi:hypothetical protein
MLVFICSKIISISFAIIYICIDPIHNIIWACNLFSLQITYTRQVTPPPICNSLVAYAFLWKLSSKYVVTFICLFFYILFPQKVVKNLKCHHSHRIHAKTKLKTTLSLDEIVGGTRIQQYMMQAMCQFQLTYIFFANVDIYFLSIFFTYISNGKANSPCSNILLPFWIHGG